MPMAQGFFGILFQSPGVTTSFFHAANAREPQRTRRPSPPRRPRTREGTVSDIVTSEAELEALYGQPARPAVFKEIDHISEHYRRFIDLSPFVVLATAGPEGLDCTPLGDPPGFVRVAD